jgi:ribosome-associated toxin RatA of RatAB toxin-antitoxin module
MFRLVDDVEHYHEFLPWCKNSHVIERKVESVEARLDIAQSGIRKSFTTINWLTPSETIVMELVEGPFKQLKGAWQFEALGDEGSKVSLDLSFEFSNKLMGMTFGPAFSKIASTLVDAFIQRAKQQYKTD